MAPSRRERELARRRYERQAARRAVEAKRRRRRTIIVAGSLGGVVVLVAVIAAIGIGVSGGKKTSTLAAKTPAPVSSSATPSPTPSAASASPTPSASASAATSSTASPTASVADARPLACYLKAPETHTTQTYPSEPALTVNADKTYTMKIATPCGYITANLDVKNAPHAVNSFAFLASKGFFNGTECHRVVTSPFSVLQCGDPTATGSGGPGYKFQDENLANATYTRGTLAMANSGPNTNGSQFFLVDQDTTQLGKQYTVFGHITSGIGTLDRIIAGGVEGGGTDGKPAKRIFINSLDVTAS